MVVAIISVIAELANAMIYPYKKLIKAYRSLLRLIGP
jgi:hypothetical protein